MCKGDDQTEAHYLFLGPKGGHPRRSNYADDFLTPLPKGSTRNAMASAGLCTSPPSLGPGSVTPEMRQQLCDYLERLWQQGLAERYAKAPRSAVPILNDLLIAHEKSLKAKSCGCPV